MSEAPTKAKPKRKVERYEFGDDIVELRQVDPDPRNAGPESHMHGPATRSKWEIHVNGVHLGFAFYPLGVGNDWVVTSLAPKNLDPKWGKLTLFWEGPDGDKGGWDDSPWDGLMGLLNPIRPNRGDTQWTDSDFRWKDRPTIAEGFLRCMRAGKTPDREGVLRAIQAAADKREREAREETERRARYAREAEERRQQQEREAAEAEERRLETLAGLESIRDKYATTELSNLEVIALNRAIEAYTK